MDMVINKNKVFFSVYDTYAPLEQQTKNQKSSIRIKNTTQNAYGIRTMEHIADYFINLYGWMNWKPSGLANKRNVLKASAIN